MKPTLPFVALSLVFASPSVSANTEIEALRNKCAEQERQIRQLELENARLRNTPPESELPQKAQIAPEAATLPSSPQTYTVKAGDNLAKIARTVGMTPASLAKQNGIKPDAMIHPGQKLKIKGTSTENIPSLATTPAPVQEATPPEKIPTYTIKAGETFSSISRKLKIPVSTLISANPKVKPTAIRAGQVINLGTPKPTAKRTTPAQVSTPPANASLATAPATPVIHSKQTLTPEPLAPSAPAALPQAAPAPIEKNPPIIRPVTIDAEVTYGDFAMRHGTDTERLNSLNGLDLTDKTVLAKGSELYVPSINQ